MFRRQESASNRVSQQAWHSWIETHRTELISIGLPPEVYLNEKHWQDFLENGHLHWHPSSGFDFSKLNSGQAAALLRFLDEAYGANSSLLNLRGWLAVRLRTT